MTNSRTTVIIPVYNGEAYIREAIESVLVQTVPCHVLLIDDGSTDATVSAAQAAGLSAYNIIRLRENKGAAFALNVGLLASPYEFVCWLSHDDVFFPTKIYHQQRMLDANESASACYTNFRIIDAKGSVQDVIYVQPPRDGGMFRQVCIQNIINGSSIMIRRKVFGELGLFREDLAVDVDGEMWLRMLAHGHQFVHSERVLLDYRRHAGQQSANKALMLKTKDAVRAEWIEKAPASMVFPTIGDYRDGLARVLHKQGLTQAAEAARRKAKEVIL